MKFILTVLLFAFPMIVSAQVSSDADTLVQFTRGQTLKLANGVQKLQDSLRFMRTLDSMKTKVIDLHEKRSEVYELQIQNRQEVFDACRAETEALRRVVETLKPKWYDNKLLWFGSGVGVATAVFLMVR